MINKYGIIFLTSIFSFLIYSCVGEDSEENTISGTFNFDAYNNTGEYTINISQGVFYRLPISVDSGN